MTADPMLREAILIDRWPKGKDTVQVQLSGYGGRNTIDVRCWYTDTDGNLKPGRNGITLHAVQLPQLTDAIGKALLIARDSDLIPEDGAP